ncbi:hypothetical protein GCM10020331_030660 [Ectobacillus funiculus]
MMKAAPFGVFALIAVTVAKFGVGTLLPLGKLILVVYGTVVFFCCCGVGDKREIDRNEYFSHL